MPSSTSLFFRMIPFLFCLLIFGCDRSPAPPAPASYPVVVKTLEVKAEDLPTSYEFVGVVQSSHEVEIRSRVPGYLSKVAFVEGSFVHRDDLLFQIDPEPYIVAFDKANANLAREEAILWDAARSVERYRPLYEQKAASRRDLDNAISKQLSSIASVQAAQTEVADAKINLGYTSILSPVSGLIGSSNFREGALISKAEDLLALVSVFNPIWITFSVSERDILHSEKQLKEGTLIFPPDNDFATEIILADQTIYPKKGKVNFAAPSYDQKTGTIQFRSTVSNPDSVLRPGQFVRIRIIGAYRPNAIAIPQKSVVQSSEGLYVFVVNENKQAEKRLVDGGRWDKDNWVISRGLKTGDVVIIEGVNKVQNRSKLVIQSQSSQS